MRFALKVQKIWPQLWFSKSIKEDDQVKMYYKTNALDWNVAFAFFVNKFEKIYENSPIELTLWSNLWFSKSFKGDNLVKIYLRLAALIQNVALVWKTYVWSLMKITSTLWKLWLCLCFSKSLKWSNFFKMQYRVMSFGQNVALVLVNKFVKFYENSLHFVKVVAEICWK